MMPRMIKYGLVFGAVCEVVAGAFALYAQKFERDVDKLVEDRNGIIRESSNLVGCVEQIHQIKEDINSVAREYQSLENQLREIQSMIEAAKRYRIEAERVEAQPQ